MKNLEKQIEAYMCSRDTLEMNYIGRWVVFYDEHLRGDFSTFEEAADFAVQNFQEGPYLIRRVGAPETTPLPASVLYRPHYA